MRPARVFAAALAAAIVIGGATATNAAVIQPVTQISGPLVANGDVVDSFPVTGGNVRPELPEVTPDSGYAVYLADQEQDEVVGLYSWPIGGSSQATRLNDPTHGNVDAFAIAPDPDTGPPPGAPEARPIAYRAGNRLFWVPAGGGTPFPLGVAPAPGLGRVDTEFVISKDWQSIVYRADADPTATVRLRLFSEALDGSGDPVLLNGSTVTGDVLVPYAISSDSNHVVYRADEDPTTTNVIELYSSPIGGGGSTRLNTTFADQLRDVASFVIAPDSQRVVYLADQDTDTADELYSTPMGGGEVVKLSGTLVPGGDVRLDFQVTPDSQRVVFDADAESDDKFELYSSPIAQAGSRVKLSDPAMDDDGDIGCLHHRPCFRIAHDSSFVVYRADQDIDQTWELYRRATDGTDPEPTKVNTPLPNTREVREEFTLSPDSKWIVYPESPTSGDIGLIDLYAGPVDLSQPVQQLNDPTGTDRRVVQEQISVTSDSSRVVYVANDATGTVAELYSRPIDGSGAPTKLNGALLAGGNVTHHQIVPDASAVMYRADQAVDEQFELFLATWAVPVAADDTAAATSGAAEPIEVLPNDTVAAGVLDPASVTVTAGPTHGTTASGAPPGTVTYTPAPGYFGPDQLTYRVCVENDSTLCDEAIVAITVTAPPPTADPDTAGVTAGNAVEINVLQGDTAVAGVLDPASVTVVTPPAHGDAEPGGAPGNVIYTADTGFSGTDHFTYSVCLQHDGALCDEGTVTVTVKAAPPKPPGPKPPTPTPPTPPKPPINAKAGYWLLESDGDLRSFGKAPSLPSVKPDLAAGASAVALASHPDGNGVWVLTSDGDIIARGSATDFGRVDLAMLTKPGEKVSTVSASPDGSGLWVFTTAGRIISFGTATPAAQMTGSSGILGLTLDGPIIDSVATPSGKGAFMVASDGGVFAVGDAGFIDSVRGVLTATYGPPGMPHQPVVGIVPDGDGKGYWNVAMDGGVFAFASPFRGSLPAILSFDQLAAPVNGMVAYGNGYLLVAGDGGVFTFSNLPFAGSAAGTVDSPVVDIAALG